MTVPNTFASVTSATGAQLDENFASIQAAIAGAAAIGGSSGQAFACSTLTASSTISGSNLSGTNTGNETVASAAEVTTGTNNTKMVTPLAARALVPGYVYIRDEKSATTTSQTLTISTWNTRTLNTKTNDASSLATLSSNQITLAAGTYTFRGRCPGGGTTIAGAHKCRLQNVTDATTIMVGSDAYINYSLSMTDSFVCGRFTIAASKALELQHQCSTANGNGGYPAGFSAVEVYAEIEFWKEA